MINKEFLRSHEEVFLYNLLKLKDDSASIQKETRLLIDSFFEAYLPSDISFERAAKSLLEVYQRFSQSRTEKEAWEASREKAILCEFLSSRFPELSNRQKFFLSAPISSQNTKTPKIAFWNSNRCSYQGFETFSALFSSAKETIAESFAEVCELVANRTADFGILPIENTSDGRLSVFYKMMDKNDLKICAVCDVEDGESDTQTRLALISKQLFSPECELPRFIEFSFVSSEEERRRELLSVTEIFRIGLVRLSSLPISYRSEVGIETVTLALNSETLLPFLIYLYLFFEDANILGYFVQL